MEKGLSRDRKDGEGGGEKERQSRFFRVSSETKRDPNQLTSEKLKWETSEEGRESLCDRESGKRKAQSYMESPFNSSHLIAFPHLESFTRAKLKFYLWSPFLPFLPLPSFLLHCISHFDVFCARRWKDSQVSERRLLSPSFLSFVMKRVPFSFSWDMLPFRLNLKLPRIESFQPLFSHFSISFVFPWWSSSL